MTDLPPIEFLDRCFEVREDGLLYWRERPIEHFKTEKAFLQWNARYAGTQAGTAASERKGRSLGLKCGDRHFQMRSHRIIFALLNWRHPAGIVSHGKEISVARKVWDSKRSPPRSGFVGVRASGNKFQAVICENYKTICLGTFETAELANAAYIAARYFRQLDAA